MAFWLLKARPAVTDLSEVVRPGRAMKWRTKRPPRGWKPTDGVFLWQASPRLQLVGCGTITDIRRPDEDGVTWFSVTYETSAIDGPRLADLRDRPVLADASFLKAGAAGTVFPVSRSEAEDLVSLLDEAAPAQLAAWARRVDADDEPAIAISIRQPYTEMILRGTKTAEYRGTATKRRGRVYIYAARKPGEPSYWDAIGLSPGELPVGLIVGTVDVLTCVENEEYGYAYELANPRRLEQPVEPLGHPQPRWFHPFPKDAND